jgi:hypothetical protein
MIRKWGSESKEFGGISGMMEGWNLNAGIMEYWKNGRMAKEAGFASGYAVPRRTAGVAYGFQLR